MPPEADPGIMSVLGSRRTDEKESHFTELQIVGVLQEHEKGAKVADLCRRYGSTETTFYRWKKKYPRAIVLDNGPEFVSHALDQWAHRRGRRASVHGAWEAPADAYGESFNGRLRDECLNENWFVSLADAQHTIEAWRVDYNVTRPHSGLDSRTPHEFAMTLRRIASSATHLLGLT